MVELSAKRLKSDIAVKATVPVESVAETISNALGIALEQNTTGKYEEFEGYEGEALGIKVTLVADPKNPDSDYDLGFYGSYGNNGETIDITSFILAILYKRTNLVCNKMT